MFATSIALINNHNFILNTNVIGELPYEFTTFTYDLKWFNSESFIEAITEVRDHKLYLKEIVVLQGLDAITVDHQKQLVVLLDQLNGYDRNDTKQSRNEYVEVNGIKVYRREFNIFIGITNNKLIKLDKNLKEKFWFSHYYSPDTKDVGVINDYKQKLLTIRHNIDKVYQSPEITGYIYSLVIHIRNHRLSTMNMIQTRLHTRVIHQVSLLAKSIVAWSNYEAICLGQFDLFVTPSTVQLAMRKVGYWLVDWESSNLLDGTDEERKKLVVNMLVGEWYGSEWQFVKEYLQSKKSHVDHKSSTGWTNSIIEDVLDNVRPPI